MGLGFLLLGAACSTRSYDGRWAETGKDTVSMQTRLDDVAFPLLVAAAEWCPFEQEPTYGFFVADALHGTEGARHQAGSVVSYVHPRLPAAAAGLAPGDYLLRVNTQDMVRVGADEITDLIRRLSLARIQPLQLEVLRRSEPRVVILWAVPACHFLVQLLADNRITAFSNGKFIAVTRGAMQFFSRDDELAWLVAHELAHNVLGHRQNAKLRAMLRAFIGATGDGAVPVLEAPPQRSLEAEADYVGVYIMAQAGYDVEAIRRVWQRLEPLETQEGGPPSTSSQTHPSTAERLAAFQKTLREIEESRRRGDALRPRTEHSVDPVLIP